MRERIREFVREHRSTLIVTGAVLLSGAYGFATASGAAGSPNNCGEVPGIALFGTFAVSFGAVLVIFAIAAIASWLSDSCAPLGYAALLSAAYIIGMMLGAGSVRGPVC